MTTKALDEDGILGRKIAPGELQAQTHGKEHLFLLCCKFPVRFNCCILVLRLRDLEERDPVDRHDRRAEMSDKRERKAGLEKKQEVRRLEVLCAVGEPDRLSQRNFRPTVGPTRGLDDRNRSSEP